MMFRSLYTAQRVLKQHTDTYI